MDNKRTPLILIVDDSEAIRSGLTILLNGFGCQVAVCIDGMDGIKKALQNKPDLFIIDILMPNLDGIKMLQVIKMIEELKNVPVIILSANTTKANVLAANEAGADRILHKPFTKNDFLKAVKELLNSNVNEIGEAMVVHSDEDYELQNDLKKLFLDSFPTQKKSILDFIKQRNKVMLRNIFHELKGIGATVGFPQVTDLSRKLEYSLANDEVDWDSIIYDCELIFSIVDKNNHHIDLEK